MGLYDYNFNPLRKNQMGLLENTPRRMSNPTYNTAPAEEKGDNTVSTLMQALQLYSGLKNTGTGTPPGVTPSRFSLNTPAEKPLPYSLNGLAANPSPTAQPYMTGLKSLNLAGNPTNWWDRMGQGGQQAFTRGLLTAGTSILEKSRPDSVMAAVSRGGLEGVNVYDQVRALQAQQDMIRRAEERATTTFGWEEGDQARKERFLTGLSGISPTETRTIPGLYEEYPTRDTSSSRFGLTGGSPPLTLDVPTRTEEVARPEYGILNEAADKAWRSGNIQEANTLYGLAEKMKPETTYPYTTPTGVEVSLGAKDYVTATKESPEPKELTLAQAIEKRDMFPTGSSDRKIWENYIQKLSTQPSGTTVNVGDRSVAKEIGPIMVASMQKATDAVNQLDIGNRIDTAIKSGTVISGPGTTPRIWLARLAQVVSPGAGNEGEALANTRNVIRGLAQYGIAARGALKGSGPISDFESKSLIKAESGEIENLTIPEIKAIVAVTNRAAKISIKGHNRQIENMRKNPDMAAMAPFYEVPNYYSETPLPGDSVKTISSDADYNALPSGSIFTDPTGKQRRKP